MNTQVPTVRDSETTQMIMTSTSWMIIACIMMCSLPDVVVAGREDPTTSEVLIGMALSTGAGLATLIGAFIVFSKTASRFASGKVLAGALSLSAGVMIYVSFVEMFSESIHMFSEAGLSDSLASLYTFLAFFGGMAICKSIDIFVHYLDGDNHHHGADEPPSVAVELRDVSHNKNNDDDEEEDVEKKVEESKQLDVEIGSSDDTKKKLDHDRGALQKMGLLTAAAVALHNFPEGLATFIGALDDTSVGATLAIAIAIHNIPEGIAVAMPIYYGTGDAKKALLWTFLSGIAEPMGALIGYVVLMDHFTDTTFGVVFALVAGMMIYISFSCLLPTAFKYDPENKVSVPFCVLGMLIMGLSIVLFDI
jgi:zinc transporter, ZIP family